MSPINIETIQVGFSRLDYTTHFDRSVYALGDEKNPSLWKLTESQPEEDINKVIEAKNEDSDRKHIKGPATDKDGRVVIKANLTTHPQLMQKGGGNIYGVWQEVSPIQASSIERVEKS